MALDPQTAMMLFNMLSQTAPTLLSALGHESDFNNFGDPENFLHDETDIATIAPNVTKALQNGYDPGLMEQTLLERTGPGYPSVEALNHIYDENKNTINPSSWYNKTLSDPDTGARIANFQVQGIGSPEYMPAYLTNPEALNAVEVFSKPEFIDPEYKKKLMFNKLNRGS